MKPTKGFTLIELLIVILILAILAIFGFTKYQDIVATAKKSFTSFI